MTLLGPMGVLFKLRDIFPWKTLSEGEAGMDSVKEVTFQLQFSTFINTLC